jgi:hypothetical protein
MTKGCSPVQHPILRVRSVGSGPPAAQNPNDYKRQQGKRNKRLLSRIPLKRGEMVELICDEGESSQLFSPAIATAHCAG